MTFTGIEKKNIALLQNFTKLLEAERKELISQLKTLKELVLQNNKTQLQSQFGFVYEEGNNYEADLLKSVLQKINLADINYYKGTGLYSVMTDNGFVQIIHEISIDSEKVNLTYNYRSNSRIIKDLDEFTDYHSEGEYSYTWQFTFKNKKLKFVRLAVAG